MDLNQYIDSYWYPFNTCVGKWVEPLVPLPWFADEKKFAAARGSEYPHCVMTKGKEFDSLLESQLSYYDLHRRAGLHLVGVKYMEYQPGICLIIMTPKGVPPSRLTKADVSPHICSTFFRFYEYYTSRMDVVSLGHPLFNSTEEYLVENLSMMNNYVSTRTNVEVKRPPSLIRARSVSGMDVELVKEVAIMYGLDPLWDDEMFESKTSKVDKELTMLMGRK